MQTKEKHPAVPLFGDYQFLSEYRSQLMGLAMLWVMLFHTENVQFPLQLFNTIKGLGFGGVDIFLLLSGLGIYCSLSQRKEEPFHSYFYRRCVRILPAYWLVVGLYSIWLRAQGRISLTVLCWNMSTLHYWFRVPGSFNWYVPALLLFYALAPLYAKLLWKTPHKGLLTAMMFPFSYLLYRLSIPLGLHYMEDFLFRIPSFAMGMLLGHYILTGKKLSRTHLTVWLAAALCGIGIAVLRNHHVLYISTCYLVNSCLVPMCLILANIIRHCKTGVFSRFLKTVGNSSLEIYLLNVIVTRESHLLAPLFHLEPHPWVYHFFIAALNLLCGIWLNHIVTTIKQKLSVKK